MYGDSHIEQSVSVNAPIQLYINFSTKNPNQNVNLLLFDDPGPVRSEITSVVRQIQRFEFDCNLAVTQKVVIGIHPALRPKPL